MDNQRLILSLGLAFVVLLIWQQWQADYAPKPVPASSVAEAGPATGAAATGASNKEDVPGASEAAAAPPGQSALPTVRAVASSKRFLVETDVYKAEIDSTGGDLRRVDLIQYPVAVDQPDNPFRILDDSPARTYIAQTGLIAGEGTAPNHYAEFSAESDRYVLAAGQDILRVPLTWVDGERVVIKTYIFRRGSYQIDVEYTIKNAAGSTWNIRQYRQLQRSRPPAESESNLIYTYTGGAIYSPEEKYEKVDFDEMDDANLARNITGGWAAMLEHYFVSAWVPPSDKAQGYYSKALGDGRYVLGMMSGQQVIAAGATEVFTDRLYIGPKIMDNLDAVAEGLHLAVDYGWITFISEPLFWLLDRIQDIFGNWGVAIIILTVLIKLAFYKLSEASYKSMANMRKLTPRLQALKEKYGDDKQKLNAAMMEMYKKEKINPLGGCLPMLVQIPVFIALYWAILESVELRQAPFALWINDLSQMDPYFVLPIIMGISMLIQQKLNPAPMDPIQAKIMMALPIVFTVFFAFFPSGLVLYWVVNNILSIAQQWVITKKIEAGEKV
ncbi:MAG: membrane protein insertase YidC [Gammaproteobacteria bacterium]|nr:membrane protein insertase YidC [Gammaproteobacteria bacterium]